jgi:hypothetical protein
MRQYWGRSALRAGDGGPGAEVWHQAKKEKGLHPPVDPRRKKETKENGFMTDDLQPPPVFPQYQPPGVQVAHPKQAKPLFKIMAKMMDARFRTRVSPVKNRLAHRKKKKDI